MESKKGKKAPGDSTSLKASPFSRKLVCINYPGIVNNVDKMLETLGGMSDIETYVGTQRRTLELKFRPKDHFCKSTISDVDKKPGILVKVTVKEPVASTSSSDVAEPELDYKVLGITALTYSFNKLCDFQYLPLVPEQEDETSDTPLSYIYDKIIPESLPEPTDWITSDESKNLPLYLPPKTFSRSDNPKNCLYFDRSKFYETRFKADYVQMLKQQEKEHKGEKTFDHKIISKKGGLGAIFYTFNEPVVPGAPPNLALQFLSFRYTNKGAYEEIKALFEKRPIWSRSAILCMTNVPKEQLKFILPAVAYYYHNGPWRVMWIKYGYDPKQDPSSRVYQTFDFRVRASAGLKAKIRSKRYYKTQKYLPTRDISVSKVSLTDVCQNKEEDDLIDESSYVLKPGVIPPARQMFYQYCDIRIPEIQSMLNRLPPVLPGTSCDFKNGWLPNQFAIQCREIANKYITEQVHKEIIEENKKQMKSDDHEKQSSSKQADSEQDKTQELLEISDSGSDVDYYPSDEDETIHDEDASSSINLRSNKGTTSERTNEEDDRDDIDLEAADDVNKILSGNYEALQEFNRLVYDSDSD